MIKNFTEMETQMASKQMHILIILREMPNESTGILQPIDWQK